jgi:hypothetical protein
MDRALRSGAGSPKRLADDLARLKAEADNLLEFIASGGSRWDPGRVREKLAATEQEIAAAKSN